MMLATARRSRPLRNRVDPFGSIVSTPERGLLMGNRGCLHDDRRTIVRHSAATRWISCMPTWQGNCRQLMTPGCYTELFFFDEATALAAGHRPCAQCRREAFLPFVTAWAEAFVLAKLPTAPEMDAVLAGERGKRPLVDARELPVGAIVSEPGSKSCWLISGGGMRRWSFAGYGVLEELPGTAMVALTPTSIIAVLRGGYIPFLGPVAPALTVSASASAR